MSAKASFVACALGFAAALGAGVPPSGIQPRLSPAPVAEGEPVTGSYAIVASRAVMASPAWREATVEALRKKYPHAQLYTWEKDVAEVRAALGRQLPAFTAFVVKPEEAGVHFTIALHTLCRALDDDPYPDTFWGVITGYDPEAARLLAEAGPIAIERALDCAGCDLTPFAEAWRYSEDHRGTMKHWKRGQMPEPESLPCNTDNTRGVLERLQRDKVQFLTTSGHATQHDWQMGYCGPNMAMVHKEGRLVAIDTQKTGYFASNPEPKVYFATGNCLIGDVDQTDCMALAWMRDGGVRQFMGYTVTTWFGAQGWGTQGTFVGKPGLYTACEAFHFTNTGIVHWLEAQPIADLRAFRLREIQQFNQPMTPGIHAYALAQLKAGKGENEVRELVKNLSGNLHDRDTVCFYGNPALDARIAGGPYTLLPPRYDAQSQVLTLSLQVAEGATDGALWLRLPGSWTYGCEASPSPGKSLLATGEADLALDNLLRFPNARLSLAAGQTLEVRLLNAKPKGTP